VNNRDVSLSIVNTSSKQLLLPCLASLESEPDRRCSAEIVVLDNASEDDSVKAVRERFPSVRVIEQRFRAGFGANHNTVIRATTGRYIYVLNEDTISQPGSLDRMVDYLDAHPRVAALGPRVVYPGGRPQPSAWRFPSPGAAVSGAFTLGRAGIVQSRGCKIRRVDWATACAILLRRSALEEVGTFDERFFVYCEETDLCRRLATAGWETRYFPEVTVVHHVSQFTAGVPERRINEHWRSRELYWAKHHSKLGGRSAAVLTGWQYAVRAGLAPLLLRLPVGVRPAGLNHKAVPLLRLHARNAWHGVHGPGIAELAAECNERLRVSGEG
jgi:N-acetylglucosaminyl-diphospho-decaprenol L-rhamnosyltransferase